MRGDAGAGLGCGDSHCVTVSPVVALTMAPPMVAACTVPRQVARSLRRRGVPNNRDSRSTCLAGPLLSAGINIISEYDHRTVLLLALMVVGNCISLFGIRYKIDVNSWL